MEYPDNQDIPSGIHLGIPQGIHLGIGVRQKVWGKCQ